MIRVWVGYEKVLLAARVLGDNRLAVEGVITK